MCKSGKLIICLQLLDCLMVNCGYPVRFLMTRKENLNRLVERFPPSPSVNLQHRPLIPLHLHVQFQLDHAMKRTLKLINKWKLSLSDKSRHRHDFSNIVLMHDLLASKSFLFPPISSEEIDAIVGLELQTLRTKESLQDEERVVLETKLEYYLSRGTPGDIKRANEIMKQMIDCQVLTRHESSSSCLQDSTKYSTADSQILQDLRRLEDKVALLEDLVKAEEDESGVAVLLQNHTISQMYRASRDEIPKLLELANSNLSESLMRTLISITERIGAVKLRVEGPEKDCHPDSPHAANVRPPVSLHHSTDALDSPLNAVESTINRPVFHDLPQLSPAQPSISTTIVARPVAFQHNSEICLDMLQVGHARTILRILNVSDGELRDIKLVASRGRWHSCVTLHL